MLDISWHVSKAKVSIQWIVFQFLAPSHQPSVFLCFLLMTLQVLEGKSEPFKRTSQWEEIYSRLTNKRSAIVFIRFWIFFPAITSLILFVLFIPYFRLLVFGKVHIFWEGPKILQNLHLTFDWHYIGQK